MDYILMHKKTAVAEMEIDEETAVISRIGTVFAPEHIPVGISVISNQPSRGDLNEWWHGRSIPASRQNIRAAIDRLGVSSADKLITKCYGLSLSDQYWANPIINPLNWDQINFFDNPFSEDVGNILFGGTAQEGKVNLVSPNNTSDGWLKKKWVIIDGKRCLIKGGSDPYQQQPINEMMAAVVMRRLSIPHVPYSVIWEQGLPYSVCENFITAQTELISAFYIHNVEKIRDAKQLYTHYLDCCAWLGIPNFRIHLDKMLAADYLIANNDRHFNNFGAVRNAETLEWIQPAPLYDNGSSLWYNQSTAAIQNAKTIKSQPFFDTHEEQIKLVKGFSWLNFTDLNGIDDEFNDLLCKSPLIDTQRQDALCIALKNRVKMLMDIAASCEKVFAFNYGNPEIDIDYVSADCGSTPHQVRSKCGLPEFRCEE